MWRLLRVLLVAGLSFGYGFANPPNEQLPAWVKSLQEGRYPGWEQCQDQEAMMAWMKRNLKRKATTRNQVFELFGKQIDPAKKRQKATEDGLIRLPVTLLNRPERDGIDTFQYHLWGADVNYGVLCIDIERSTGLLLDYGISYCVCGFCPHVLAADGETWNLEGKLLAGRVGPGRAGTDLLVLPRLNVREGLARVVLANWAPEREELGSPKLLGATLRPGQELDVGATGQPVVWRPQQEVSLTDHHLQGRERLEIPADQDVMVLEVKNSFALEAYLRGVHLQGRPESLNTALDVEFGSGQTVTVSPVGTKFLRRVVVPVPAQAKEVTLRGRNGFWFSRRIWFGIRETSGDGLTWYAPNGDEDTSFSLMPNETRKLTFSIPQGAHQAFALQLNGYYSFLPSAKATPGEAP